MPLERSAKIRAGRRYMEEQRARCDDEGDEDAEQWVSLLCDIEATADPARYYEDFAEMIPELEYERNKKEMDKLMEEVRALADSAQGPLSGGNEEDNTRTERERRVGNAGGARAAKRILYAVAAIYFILLSRGWTFESVLEEIKAKTAVLFSG